MGFVFPLPPPPHVPPCAQVGVQVRATCPCQAGLYFLLCVSPSYVKAVQAGDYVCGMFLLGCTAQKMAFKEILDIKQLRSGSD
jgi:hypothetical protein